MARTDTLGHFLTDVADAIRTKTGSSDAIIASDFDTAIENIPSGGGEDTELEMRKSDLLLGYSFPGLRMTERNYTQTEIQKVDDLITLYENLYEEEI